MRINVVARNAMLQLLVALIGAAGKAKGYTGAPPANPGQAPSGTLLFTILLANPALLTAANGQIAFAPANPVAAAEGGELGFLRVEDSSGVGILDFPVSELTVPGPLGKGSTVILQSLIAILPLGA